MDGTPRIIVLEDDLDQRSYLTAILERAGYTVAGTYTSGEEALGDLERSNPDLILADALLAGEMDGAEVIHLIQRRRTLPTIFLTAHSDNQHLIRLCQQHPAALLIKPCQPEELIAAVQLALEEHRRTTEHQAAQQQTIDSLAQGNVRSIMLTDALTRLLRDALDGEFQNESFTSRLLDELRVLVDSPYAAFVSREGEEAAQFITRGIDPETQARIGHPPRGLGLLGRLYEEGEAICVDDVQSHPAAAGFPPHHPPMGPLLGMPIHIEGKMAGLIYLARKQDAEPFRRTESELVRLFAIQAGHLLHRERLHQDLRRTHDRLHTLLSDSPVVIFDTDRQTPERLQYVSENATSILGISPDTLLSSPWLDHIHEDDRPRILTLLQDARTSGFLVARCRIVDEEGQLRWIEIRAHHRRERPHLVGVMQDVTEEKKVRDALEHSHEQLKQAYQELREAQDQALQSEKLASIGQLAAGVAHEINNPLGYIGSNLRSLEQDLSDLFDLLETYQEALSALPMEHPARRRAKAAEAALDWEYLRNDLPKLIQESGEGVERARTIVRDLKDFSRAGDGCFVSIDLHRGLESTLNIAHNQIKYKAEIIKDLDPELPEITCIPAQINQVILNLLINAAQAIPERGTIILRTRHDDSTVTIEVSDTGIGIPPEVRRRIFDPFFTTKPQGKGTGLGLSLSYGIVQRHGGRIEVESTPGEGATFRVVLPRDANTAKGERP